MKALLRQCWTVLMLAVSFPIIAQPAGYTFKKQIVIDASQVSGSSDHSNFPVLISLTDNDLRSTANGGHVENSNGFDIVFTDGDCSSLLNHDLEYYNSATGEVVIWVNIPTLSASANTGINMYYGNSSIATDQSSTNTWAAGFDGVWHLHDDVNDASGNANNGTNNGSTDESPAKIGDGQNFVDPNHWIELPSHTNRSGSFSYSGWIRTDDRSRAGQRVICDDATNGSGGHAISLGDPGAGRLRFYIRGLNPISLDSPSGTITNGNWFHVAATYNSSTNTKALYINGTLVASASVTGTLGSAAGNASIGGEIASGESGNRFHGDLDEIRSISSVLSADWIATEFNNQNTPSSFYSVSSELAASTSCAILPIELIRFDAIRLDETTVELSWTTATETQNDYFTIEKSLDQTSWEVVIDKPGAGDSHSPIHYNFIDYEAPTETSYYRLKQTDFNGDYSYSEVLEVTAFGAAMSATVYPNPTSRFITIKTDNADKKSIKCFSSLGIDLSDKLNYTAVSSTEIKADLTEVLPQTIILIIEGEAFRVNVLP